MPTTKPTRSGRTKMINFTMRMEKGLIDDLDAWATDLNKGRRVGLVTRSDIIRVMLERGVKNRPNLDEEET